MERGLSDLHLNTQTREERHTLPSIPSSACFYGMLPLLNDARCICPCVWREVRKVQRCSRATVNTHAQKGRTIFRCQSFHWSFSQSLKRTELPSLPSLSQTLIFLVLTIQGIIFLISVSSGLSPARHLETRCTYRHVWSLFWEISQIHMQMCTFSLIFQTYHNHLYVYMYVCMPICNLFIFKREHPLWGSI